MNELEKYFRSPSTEEVNEAVEDWSESLSYWSYHGRRHFSKRKSEEK